MHLPKRILVCPLDWGLGHATRCIPIIRLLLKKGAHVIIAADGRPFDLLSQEFPELQFIRLPGYSISYPDKGSMALKMLLSVPKIIGGIKNEHGALDRIVDENKIDIIVSDNRYGCWNKKTKNIFITHQIMIKSPCAENLLNKIVLNHIKNYHECWIPDIKGENNLSGDLAHKYHLPENAFFIGYLSRFNKQEQDQNHFPDKYDLMAIVSGPEPQRTNFERLILDQLSQSNLKSLVVLGKPEVHQTEKKGNITIASHLNAEEIQSAILNSKIIIARSGYSTIMDLAVLNKKAVFIPTPGQTEQQYLAQKLKKEKIAFSSDQNNFDLKKALKESENFNGFLQTEGTDNLEQRIESILS